MTKETLKDLQSEYDKTMLNDYCEILETAMDYSEAENADEFIEYFTETYIHSAEIIYYHTAMEFLRDNDPSLQLSNSLAYEYGYQTGDINSKLLATLLLQQMLAEELEGLRDELNAYFDDLAESEEV